MTDNKIGICEWVFPVQGPEALRWASNLGFDGIQITERNGWESGYPLLNPKIQREYFQAQEETGIEIQALHLWSLCRLACMIHPLDSEAGKLALDYLEKSVQCCKQMSISNLLLTSGFLCQIKNQKDFHIFSQYLSAACKFGIDAGVQIVFESVLTPIEILEMCDQVEGLKICYDFFNPIRFASGEPIKEIRKIGLMNIDHFHVKDGPANMIGCALLGEGVGDYFDIIEYLSEQHYKGWLISENYYNTPPISLSESFNDAAKRDLLTLRNFKRNVRAHSNANVR